MRNIMALPIISFILLAAVVNASYVNITSPFNYTVTGNGTVALGNVGPGQTFFVTISSVTRNSTNFTFNQGWNRLDASDLPAGWIAQNSSLNNQALSTAITVAPAATYGPYSFNLTAVNLGNYSRLGSKTFTVEINVTPNVFKLSASPSVLNAGPGQPDQISVTINNTGVSDTPFVISLGGIPAWNNTQTVIALHHTTGRFQYPVYENEPGVYNIKLYVNSTASPLISKESDLMLVVGASVRNDYSAIGQGTPLFPIVYEPAYAVMYFLGLLAKAL
ncbi:MAG: hypothetical protein KGH94_01410 [Candidatus Micrarchaeota archaeon]|nr:hypothetical protein [Candidatus Micrarchaeota archaeon]